MPIRFDAGGFQDITGTAVAVVYGMAEVGDEPRLESPDDTSVTVTVAAAIEPTQFFDGSLLVGQDTFPLTNGTLEETWLAESAPGATQQRLVDALEELFPSGAGAAILALFTLAQSTFTSIRERRKEFSLLPRVGARRCSIISSIIIESAITTVTTALPSVLVSAIVALRMSTALHAQSAPTLRAYQ